MGYLFLDKLFQLSAPLPVVPPARISSYWNNLLKMDGTKGAATAGSRTVEELRTDASDKLSKVTDQRVIQETIDAESDEFMKRALREEAAKVITSPEAERELEHRYRHYVELMEPNPRALKRLVNYVGIQQAVKYLEGRSIPADLLARWCILEMRWPQFALHLQQNPHWLNKRPRPPIPEPWRSLIKDKAMKDVLGKKVGGDIEFVGLNKHWLMKIQGRDTVDG